MAYNFDHIDPGNAHGSVKIPQLSPSPPKVITWPCNECSAAFDDLESLRRHRLDEHPLKRPSLHIRGLKNSTHRYSITRTLTPDCLHFENTQTIQIDGRDYDSPEQAAEFLASFRRERVSVRLGYSTYTATYDLKFDVIEDATAAHIERDFLESVVEGSLASSLQAFNRRVKSLQGGRGYVAALQAYLTAMMAKDGVAGAVINQGGYIVKLGESLDGLEIIERPFAKAIASLIRFMRNDLRQSKADEPFPFLVHVKQALTDGILSAEGSSVGEASFAVPLDSVTERIVMFVTAGKSHRSAEGPSLLQVLGSGHISDSDALKMRLALLAWSKEANDRELAREQFQQLIHRAEIGGYAARIAKDFI